MCERETFSPTGGTVMDIHHRRARAVLAALLIGLAPADVPPVRADAAREVDEIMAAADRGRNGWDSFSVAVTITNYKKERLESTSSYEVLIKGADRTLVRFNDPRDKGKLLLMLEDAMWLYMPSTSRPIRVTPLQRLSGNASNGDVAQTSLAAHYAAALVGREAVDGEPAYVLDLTARKKSATYQQVRYWVAEKTLLPLKAEFQLASGKPSKTCRYERYETVAGRPVLRRMVILDLLRADQKTVMEYEKYAPRELEDRFFNRNFLAEL
jgi:outer membrane lipoprotein-sorting protein